MAVMTVACTTSAAAQFGALKKKLKRQPTADASAPAAPADPAASGGTIVLTDDVIERFVTGVKAGQAERDRARQENTSYGRYERAQAEYATAKEKCELARQTFPQKMAADEKLMDRYNALADKMVKAQERGDQRAVELYSDSASAMADPSCVVKEPKQPDDYYEAQRAVDARADKQVAKASGFSQGELGLVLERVEGILRGTPPPDASASEKAAVSARAAELRSLLGIEDPAARKAKPAAAAPAPAAHPAPAAPQMSPAASAMNDCRMKNVQAQQAEIEALGQRAEKAQAAGNTGAMMAIADTLRQIQMAGCH
jgi:hypothetical protein